MSEAVPNSDVALSDAPSNKRRLGRVLAGVALALTLTVGFASQALADTYGTAGIMAALGGANSSQYVAGTAHTTCYTQSNQIHTNVATRSDFAGSNQWVYVEVSIHDVYGRRLDLRASGVVLASTIHQSVFSFTWNGAEHTRYATMANIWKFDHTTGRWSAPYPLFPNHGTNTGDYRNPYHFNANGSCSTSL
jgi:hypothetical protein